MFVPVVPPPTPSPRARDLGEHLATLIAEYARQYPDTRPLDVQQALHIAAQRAGGDARVPVRLAFILGVVMLVALGGFFVFVRSSGGADAPFPFVAVLLGVGIVASLLGAIIVLKR